VISEREILRRKVSKPRQLREIPGF
jgi:hypothetical protein